MLPIVYARLKNLYRNPKVVLMMLIMPLVFTALFAVMNVEEGKLLLPVVDEDKSVFSAKLLDDLARSTSFAIAVVSREEMLSLVSEYEAEIGLLIPPGFGDAVQQGQTPSLQMVQARDTLTAASVSGMLRTSVQRLQVNNKIAAASAVAMEKHLDLSTAQQARIKERLDALAAEKWREELPVKVQGQYLASQTSVPNDHVTYSSLGFALFFSTFTIIFAVAEILEDKKSGLWNRLVISALSKTQIYVGNLIYAFGIGFFNICLLFVAGKYIFAVNLGHNLAGLLLVVAAYTFAAVALGLMLSTIIRTTQQLQSIVPIVVVSTSMLGGLYWPLEMVSSKALLFVAKFLPQTWAMQALRDLTIYNKGMEAVYPPVAVLIFMGTVLLGTSLQIRES